MKLDSVLAAGTLPTGRQGSLSSSDSVLASALPSKVTEVGKEVLKTFPHSKRVGNYLLGKTLGEGSFAKVKEGLHIVTGEKVAVKVIDKKKAKEDTYVRKNMRREGKLLQAVRHRHILSLYEIMETENSYYLVTELCEGGDLMDHICAKRKLEEREVRRYIRQVVSAVEHLHKAGILHRDLKVENLLLDENRDIKIIDFGLSNSVRVSQTQEGSAIQEFCVTQCGSPAYAAPELLGNKKYGPKIDIWSIGVNMYAMLTGNLPFTVEPFNIKVLHNKMLSGDMNPIPDSLSRHCKDLLRSFLNPDPDKRITLHEAMQHPWINEGKAGMLESAPFPNKLNADDLDTSIVNHMSGSLDYRISEVIRLVTSNIPSSATATYHMYNRKLRKFNAEMRVKGKVAAADVRMYGNVQTRDYIEVLSVPDHTHCTKIRRNPAQQERKENPSTNRPTTMPMSPKKTDMESRRARRNTKSIRHSQSREIRDVSPPRNATNQPSDVIITRRDGCSSAEDVRISTDVFRPTPYEKPTPDSSPPADVRLFRMPANQGTSRTNHGNFAPPHHPANRRRGSETHRLHRCNDQHPLKNGNASDGNPIELPSVGTNERIVTPEAVVRNTFPSDKLPGYQANGSTGREKLLQYRSRHTDKSQVQNHGFVAGVLEKAATDGVSMKSTSQSTLSSSTRRSQSCGPVNKTSKPVTPASDCKASISDPVTKQELSSVQTGQSPPRRYLIDINHYERYTRRASSRLPHSDHHNKSPELKRPNRNINYLTFNKIRNTRPIGSPAKTVKSHVSNEGCLNVTGESAGLNGAVTPRFMGMKRGSLEAPRVVDRTDEASVMEITIECKLDGMSDGEDKGTACTDVTDNVALPSISPPLVKHKSVY